MTEKLLLIKPDLSLEQEIIAYKNEFKDSLSELHGASSLEKFDSISEWIHWLPLNESYETLPNKDFVPGIQYVLMRKSDKKIVGMSHLRLDLNDYLFHFAGHIGYSVAPSERKKGYATAMLKDTLEKAKEFRLEKVLITCDDDNLGSARTIENNRGVLENKLFEKESDKWIRRYWISLS